MIAKNLEFFDKNGYNRNGFDKNGYDVYLTEFKKEVNEAIMTAAQVLNRNLETRKPQQLHVEDYQQRSVESEYWKNLYICHTFIIVQNTLLSIVSEFYFYIWEIAVGCIWNGNQIFAICPFL